MKRKKIKKVKAWAILSHRGTLLRVRALKKIAQDDVQISIGKLSTKGCDKYVPCTITYEVKTP